MPKPLCFYSIVRYVSHPLRNEARNIGVILLCPERRFSQTRFLLLQAGLSSDSRQYAMLQSVMHSYEREVATWTQETLEEMHRSHTNLIQFSRPGAALGEPLEWIEELYQERVVPLEEESHVNSG